MTSRRYLLLFLIASILAQTGPARSLEAEQAPDTMAARVLACASCHGDKGQGTKDDYFPRLAGKPAGYLYNQLIAFREGRRKYPPMNYLLEFLPDPYLKAMADFFASEQPPFPPPATPTVSGAILARGELLATKGDPFHEVPACANCHGPAFTGMEPSIPGLLGLRTNYITAASAGATARAPRLRLIASDCRGPSYRGRCYGSSRLAVLATDTGKPHTGGARPVADAKPIMIGTSIRQKGRRGRVLQDVAEQV